MARPKTKQDTETQTPVSRKDILKKAVIQCINRLNPEVHKKFDITKYIEPGGTRGLFRDEMKGDLKPKDKKIVSEIMAELKNEGILYHVGGRYWTRLL